MKYVYAKFTRGTGLGNRLFPWARSYIHAKYNNCEIIAPSWAHVRRGPLLRSNTIMGGIALRDFLGKILLFGNFTNIGYTGGIKKIILLLKKYFFQNEQIVIFAGDGNFFDDLRGFNDEIKNELWRLAKNKEKIIHCENIKIIINVRLGRDFKTPKSNSEFYSKGLLLSPLEWYVAALRALRQELNEDMPAIIISDGTNNELLDLLKEPFVTRFISHTAIEDLLMMSNAEHIVGTGGSSFTAWGGFLSQANVITIDGQSANWFKLQSCSAGKIRTFDMIKK